MPILKFAAKHQCNAVCISYGQIFFVFQTCSYKTMNFLLCIELKWIYLSNNIKILSRYLPLCLSRISQDRNWRATHLAFGGMYLLLPKFRVHFKLTQLILKMAIVTTLMWKLLLSTPPALSKVIPYSPSALKLGSETTKHRFIKRSSLVNIREKYLSNLRD